MYELKNGLHFHGSLEYASRDELLEIIATQDKEESTEIDSILDLLERKSKEVERLRGELKKIIDCVMEVSI